ncbi:MAG: YfhO family protein, partial [Clostridia bacterium]|nr:YfhO family protein [Clostridia bacterium]
MEEIVKAKTFKEKATVFFDKNYPLFFAPVLVLVAFVCALVSYGVYPFGTNYTLASYDLSAQICPFIEHLFDVLDGKSSLFYSYAIAGGADVFGTFLYFFVSPFSFLFLIFGDGMVAHASSIVMGLKVAAIAFSGAWFAQRLFKNIPEYICTVIGVVYAYCGYTFVSCTYINWMDFLIYLPFCAWAFKRFVQTGKYVAFSVLTACCVYTCFSIACFSMLTAFPALIFYALFCVDRTERKLFITRLCLAFVVAILMSLPVLFPALVAYLRSGRGGDGGIFENLWFGFSALPDGTLGNFNSSTFLDDWSLALYRKWSYILSDSVFVALTLVWFCRKGLKAPFAKFMLAAAALTLLPVLVDEAMLLLNMGSYMSYALRFGFLNALYFLGGACLAIEDLCFEKNRAFDGGFLKPVKTENEGGRYKTNGYTVTIIAIGVAVAAFLVWFISAEHYKNIWNGLTTDSEILEAFQSLPARFAHSLGGLEVIAVFFVLVVIVAGVGCAFVGAKRISPRLLSYVLILVVGVQVLFYNNQLVLGNCSTQHVDLMTYQSLCAQLNERDDGHFRVKDYHDKLTATAPFTGDSHSFSVFSSVIDKDNFVIYNLFGYQGNGKNSLKSAHSSGKSNRSDEFGDSFLGYKYYFVPQDKKDEILTDYKLKKYVKPLFVTDENGMQIQLSQGGYYIFENKIVFPSAYRVGSGEFRFTHENDGSSTNRKYNQQALYQFL